MACKNCSCEFESKLQRALTFRLSRDRVKYARLWSEVELPKLLETSAREFKSSKRK